MASIGSNSSVQEPEVAASGADIVVALTSCNDAPTTASVIRAVRNSLARHFESSETQIVLADAGSTDGTREAAREAAGATAFVNVEYSLPQGSVDMPYHGHPGRSGALRAILQAAQRAGAKACALIDGSLSPAEPDWVQRLIAPVLSDGFDYVSPCYARRVNDGAITKAIVYPMFRALYGARLRQPAAGEFGCSGRLAAHYLEQDFWDVEQAQVGIDLWLAVTAVCGEFRVCETVLGIHRTTSRHAQPDLSTTLAQIVGALFVDIEHRVDVWQRTRRSVPVPVIGTGSGVALEAAVVNVEELTESFRLGYRELREIWTWVLPPRTIVELRRLTEAVPDRFRLDDRIWAEIVYDFAIGHALRVMPRDHLLRSLTPLYIGWLASFLLQVKTASPQEVDERIEQVCQAFEAERRHLISRWRWPERFR